MLAVLSSSLGLLAQPSLMRQPVSAAASRSVLTMGPSAADELVLLQQLPTTLVADDGGGIVGLIATGIVAALGLFIASYAFKALQEVASQAPDRAERIFGEDGGGGKQQQKQEFVYDDSGTGANNKKPEKGLLKKSKQFKADGSKYAPWQNIDENRLEQAKKERARQKRK